MTSLTENQEFTAYVAAIPTAEYQDAPTAACFTVTAQFLKRIASLCEVVRTHGLSMACAPDGITWADEDSFGITLEELYVTADSFYWHAYGGNDAQVETRAVRVAELEKEIAEAVSEGRNELFFHLTPDEAVTAGVKAEEVEDEED